jgi:Ca2+-binding EF-hand superfamily protein
MFEDDSPDAKIKITYAGVASSYSNYDEFVLSQDWDRQCNDVYSIGMIAFKLLSGGKEPPTDTDTQLVQLGTNLFLGRRWKLISISRNAKKFIERCLQQESTRQFTVEQAIRHPWITQESAYKTIASRPIVEKDNTTTSAGSSELTSVTATGNSDGPVATPVSQEECVAVEPVSLSTEQYNLEMIRISDDCDLVETASLLSEPCTEERSQPVTVPISINVTDKGTLRDESAHEVSSQHVTEPPSMDKPAEECLLNEGNEPTHEVLSEAVPDPTLLVVQDEASLPSELTTVVMSETAAEPLSTFMSDEESLPIETTPEGLSEVIADVLDETSMPKESTTTTAGPLSIDVSDETSLPESLVSEAPDEVNEAQQSQPRRTELPEFLHTSTPAEFRDLHEVFHQAATDNGGDVTLEDLKARLRMKYTEEEVNSWFQGGKFDDSRNLKYTEFLAEAIRSRRKIEIRRVREAFEAIDKGRKGFVTVGNLRAVLGTNNSENIELLIKAADTKRDGKITYANFEAVVKQWLGTDDV